MPLTSGARRLSILQVRTPLRWLDQCRLCVRNTHQLSIELWKMTVADLRRTGD